jgi:hypothetical protein
MLMKFLGKLLFPRSQAWEQHRRAKILVAVIMTAIIFAAIVGALIYLLNGRR